eukprot:scaffold37401_cov25-Tisochrysis_lutea.AAC.2
MEARDEARRAAARPDLPTPVQRRRPVHASSTLTAFFAATRSICSFARWMAAAPRLRASRNAAMPSAQNAASPSAGARLSPASCEAPGEESGADAALGVTTQVSTVPPTRSASRGCAAPLLGSEGTVSIRGKPMRSSSSSTRCSGHCVGPSHSALSGDS